MSECSPLSSSGVAADHTAPDTAAAAAASTASAASAAAASSSSALVSGEKGMSRSQINDLPQLSTNIMQMPQRSRASSAPPQTPIGDASVTPPTLPAASDRSSEEPPTHGSGSGSSGSETSPSISPPFTSLSQSSSSSRALLRLKEKLRALDAEYTKQEQENTQKGMFLAFLCHELRNPLQVITANTDFLLEDAAEAESAAQGAALNASANGKSATLSADQRELITSINASAEMMLSIVNDVLDMSRLQSGRMSFERLPIDLHFICHSILNISRSQASSKNLRLELHIEEAVPRFVISDPTRIHQLLLNLISNAIKFTTIGGVSLTLRVAPTPARGLHHSSPKNGVSLLPDFDPRKRGSTDDSSIPSAARSASDASDSSEDAGNKVLIELEVKDTGAGIPPESLGKLFTPYAQAKTSTNREHGGSGLGLSICTQIAKAMGGRIEVTSEVGVGSVFTAQLELEVCDDESIRRGLGTSAGSYSNSPNLRRMVNAHHAKAEAAALAATAASTASVLGVDTTAQPMPTPHPSDSNAAILLPSPGIVAASSFSPASLAPSIVSIPESSASPAGSSVDGASERVLVVDDQVPNCKLLKRMMTSLGFEVDVAQDGVEAIELIRAHTKNATASRSASDGSDAGAASPVCAYLCVFLDLNMPRMDGWTCVSHIRNDMQLTDLPVIALTAESVDPAKAAEAGFTMALSKPFRKPALLNILEPLLEAKHNGSARATPDGEESNSNSSPVQQESPNGMHSSFTGGHDGSGSGSDTSSAPSSTGSSISNSTHTTPDLNSSVGSLSITASTTSTAAVTPVAAPTSSPVAGVSPLGVLTSAESLAAALASPAVVLASPGHSQIATTKFNSPVAPALPILSVGSDVVALPASPHTISAAKAEGALNALINASKADPHAAPSKDLSSPPQAAHNRVLSVETNTAPYQSPSCSPEQPTAISSTRSTTSSNGSVGFGDLLHANPVDVASRPLDTRRSSAGTNDATSARSMPSVSPNSNSAASASPPLRPSRRQRDYQSPSLTGIAGPAEGANPLSLALSSAECTPSSHRRSIRGSVQAPPLPTTPTTRIQSSAVSRLRGGGTNSPLSLTNSPRTVPRHLVIEPSQVSVMAGAGSRRSNSANGGSVVSSASMSSISDSILGMTSNTSGGSCSSGYQSAADDSAERRKHLMHTGSELPPRAKSSSLGHIDFAAAPLSIQQPTSVLDPSIPPLHPTMRLGPSPSPSPGFSPSPMAASIPSSSFGAGHGAATSTASPSSTLSGATTNSPADSRSSSSMERNPELVSAMCHSDAQEAHDRRASFRNSRALNLVAADRNEDGGTTSDPATRRRSSHHLAVPHARRPRGRSDGQIVPPSLTGSSGSSSSRGCGSGSSSDSSVSPCRPCYQVGGHSLPREPRSAFNKRESEKARRCAAKLRLNQTNTEEIRVVAPPTLMIGLDGELVHSPPSALRAPPCTPLSPVKAADLSPPGLQGAYALPFPHSVFHGVDEAARPTSSATMLASPSPVPLSRAEHVAAKNRAVSRNARHEMRHSIGGGGGSIPSSFTESSDASVSQLPV